MAVTIRDASGTNRTITKCFVQDAGGITRTIKTIKVYDGATWRTVATFVEPISLSLSDEYVLAIAGSATITSKIVTATPTGGTAPFTYLWTLVSHSGGVAPTINTPTTASTTFTKTGVAPDASATFRCTVTSATGGSASAEVLVAFTNLS